MAASMTESDDLLVEGTLKTGIVIRPVVYGIRTKRCYVLPGNPDGDAQIRTDAIRQETEFQDPSAQA